MIVFPREPVNTLTHAAGLAFALPATLVLLRRAGSDLLRRLSVLVYGFGLTLCYAASTLVHGLPYPLSDLDAFERLDRVGIFVLIAGTYTPIAWCLLSGSWRVATLAIVWAVTVTAGATVAAYGKFPNSITTGVYLGLGWGSVACLREVARVVPVRKLSWLLAGGLLYSIGALINLCRWPTLWPHLLGPHECFHVFVLAGSATHFWFVLKVAVPHQPSTTAGLTGQRTFVSTA